MNIRGTKIACLAVLMLATVLMASADAGRLVKMMAVIDADTEVVEVEVCCEADTECCDSKKRCGLMKRMKAKRACTEEACCDTEEEVAAEAEVAEECATCDDAECCDSKKRCGLMKRMKAKRACCSEEVCCEE